MITGVTNSIKVFSLLFMLSNSGVSLSDPILWWIMGFIFLFTVGGVTGVVLSASSLDSSFHDTWFVVAHFHYMLSSGSYSIVVITIVWWWYFIVRYFFNKYLLQGRWLVSMFGFYLCFFPMYYLGLHGSTRRISCYDTEYYWVNVLSSNVAVISVFGAMA